MTRLNCTYFLSDFISPAVFYGISIAITFVVISYVFFKHRDVVALVAVTAIVSGGLQNMVQRVVYNCVVDNIDFFGLFVYNKADFLITSGVILLIFSLIFKKNEQ